MLLKLISWIFTWIVLLFLAGCGAVFWIFYHYGQGLPDYEKLAQYEPPVLSRLYASDGRLFREYAEQKRVFIPVSAVPPSVIQTFLVAEDKNFYEHFGLDILGIGRAALTNLANRGQKRPVGASTITQQVAKNFLLASNEVSLERKIKEAILALRIEKAFPKNKILELYLNEIYLGRGSYGIAAAALTYFNKSLEELNIEEAAFLAGLPKAPSRYDPIQAPTLAKSRRDWVIGRMVEEGVITFEEGRKAQQEPILLRKRGVEQVVVADYFAEEVRRQLVQRYGEKALYKEGLVVKTSLNPRLQKIAEKALQTGLKSYDRRHGWRGPVRHLSLFQMRQWTEIFGKTQAPPGVTPWILGLVLQVTPSKAEIVLQNGDYGHIPLENLKWARRALKEGRVAQEVRKASDVLERGNIVLVQPDLNPPEPSNAKGRYTLEQMPQANGGVVVLDPLTGRILALVGGYSFESSQFDRATLAMRQSGSAFKPFVYLAALEKGMTPSSLVNDAPISIPLGRGLGFYQPNNITKQFYGPTTLRVALEKSRNVVTVRLAAEYVGIKRIADLTERLGIMKKMPRQFAMALGAGESTLLALTTAYGMVANGGKRIAPTFIDLIHNRHGQILFNAETRTCKGCQESFEAQPTPPSIVDKRDQVVDPVAAYQLISMLEGVIQRGTGRLLRELGRPLAGKTGTTNSFRDGIFVGVSPELVVGIFIGHDDFKTLGDKETGARVAAPVFLEFGKEAFEGLAVTPFKIPPGVRLVRIHSATGLPASAKDTNTIFEAFRSDGKEDEIPEDGDEMTDLIESQGETDEEDSNLDEDGSEMPQLVEDETSEFNIRPVPTISPSQPKEKTPDANPSDPIDEPMLEGTGGIY
ncbi:MAG: penicillin-binding protein 1A [Alphaproteobacteria bacterium]